MTNLFNLIAGTAPPPPPPSGVIAKPSETGEAAPIPTV